MNKLIFCYAVYNCGKTLRKSLESVKPYADRIIIVEGRFKNHWRPTRELHSTDGTIEIARKYADELILAGDLVQHKQRDLYLKGGEGDYYFIVDGDEELCTKFNEVSPEKAYCFKKMLSRSEVWAVPVFRNGRFEQLCLRIFKHKPGIHHNVGQCPLIDDKGCLMDAANYHVAKAETFWLNHLKPSLSQGL